MASPRGCCAPSIRPPTAFAGKRVTGLRRIGKRLVLEFEDDLFVVIHLMVAGRLRRRDPGTAIPPKRGLAAFDFAEHTFLLTEEGTKKRAIDPPAARGRRARRPRSGRGRAARRWTAADFGGGPDLASATPSSGPSPTPG